MYGYSTRAWIVSPRRGEANRKLLARLIVVATITSDCLEVEGCEDLALRISQRTLHVVTRCKRSNAGGCSGQDKIAFLCPTVSLMNKL